MLGGAGCQSTGPTVISNELPFDQAVIEATDGLVAQTQKLPAFLAKVEAKVAKEGADHRSDDRRRVRPADARDAPTRAEGVRAPEHASIRSSSVLPFQSANLARAQYLLTGTMVRSAGSGARKPFQINLALVELSTRSVLAQASALARDDGLDTSPTAYYQDSPVLVKDQVVDGYIRTAQTAPGQAADAYYLDRLAASRADQRWQQCLQRQPVPRRAGPVPQRAVHLRRRAVACAQRRVPRELEARPHRRRRAGLRPRGRVRPEPAQPGREVPVQPGQHRVLVGPQGQRPVRDVAAPDRAPGQLPPRCA